LAAIVAEEDDEGIPLYSPAPQEPELTPEQEEAKRKLDGFTSALYADYNLVKNFEVGELPDHLKLENIRYTYDQYLAGIQNGTITVDDVVDLIFGRTDVLVAPEARQEENDLPEIANTRARLASDPESIYLQLHGEPYPHPAEIGDFRFVSRFEWEAADINTGVGGDPEGVFNTDNIEGYMIYEQIYDIPFEEVYTMIVLHDTGIASTGFGVTSDDPFEANIERMHIMQVNSHQKPPDLDENGNAIADTGNDWADLGYQFVIGTDGTIFEGRDIRARGANVELVEDPTTKEVTVGNTGVMGIALIGNDELEEPTPEQLAALDALLNYLLGLLPNVSCIAGHGLLNPELKG